jgi:hypothetical protein
MRSAGTPAASTDVISIPSTAGIIEASISMPWRSSGIDGVGAPAARCALNIWTMLSNCGLGIVQ